MTTLARPPAASIADLTPLFAARASRSHDEPASSGPPHTTCLLATLPRSGSWLLAEMLWNTGLVGQPHEYFRPDFLHLWAAEWQLPATPDLPTFIDAAFANTTTPNGVFAAKVHWYQFAWLAETLARSSGTRPTGGAEGSASLKLADWFPNPHVVLLRRRDTARQAISYYLAAVSSVWFRSGAGQPPTALPDVDLQQIRWFEDSLIEHEANWRSFIAASSDTAMEVCYEDLAADLEGTVRRILRFLHLDNDTDDTDTDDTDNDTGHNDTDGKLTARDVASRRATIRPPRLQVQAGAATEDVLRRYHAVRDDLEPRPAGLVWRDEVRRFVRSD